jgi:hypothetical protein
MRVRSVMAPLDRSNMAQNVCRAGPTCTAAAQIMNCSPNTPT